ncbi:Os01g0610050 [Oryza sativa Japonica Group]|uniref:Os01g0610050 protein n=1 Tax=Oryza sativa subsp. japonica TaxID=39947 RepID=C7IX54_ORYSJ|nr:Os01g0610050 [Oryza sativa Japonica Group]|eukprot:NP_001172461.1 Os01g0610050 [Oryza sativa Japonica Group]
MGRRSFIGGGGLDPGIASF